MRRATGGIQAALWVYCTVSISATPTSAAGDSRFFSETVKVAEHNPVTRYVLLTEDKKFTFFSPSGWNVRMDKGKQSINLLAEDFKAGIVMRLDPKKEGDEMKPAFGNLRSNVLERFSRARVVHEFEYPVGLRKGHVLDIRRIVGTNTVAGTRIAFVACDRGLLEFELTAAADQIEKYHLAFDRVLNSFRIEPLNAPKTFASPENRED